MLGERVRRRQLGRGGFSAALLRFRFGFGEFALAARRLALQLLGAFERHDARFFQGGPLAFHDFEQTLRFLALALQALPLRIRRLRFRAETGERRGLKGGHRRQVVEDRRGGEGVGDVFLPEALVLAALGRPFGDSGARHVEDGHVHIRHGAGRGADQRVLVAAQLLELAEAQAGGVALRMGVPRRVLHHVGEDEERLRPGCGGELQARLFDGLDEVGVGHGAVVLRRQAPDSALQPVASGAEPHGGFALGELGRQVFTSVVRGAREFKQGAVVGFAEAVHGLARRCCGTGEGEDAQLGVGRQAGGDIAHGLGEKRRSAVVPRLAQVEQKHRAFRDGALADRTQVAVALIGLRWFAEVHGNPGSDHPNEDDRQAHAEDAATAASAFLRSTMGSQRAAPSHASAPPASATSGPQSARPWTGGTSRVPSNPATPAVRRRETSVEPL